MISKIEALNYRCLKSISQPLGPFQILVGPNASGKTTFLDVVAFLSTLISDGLEAAIGQRTQNYQDLLWGREGESFQFGVELTVPSLIPRVNGDEKLVDIRYEVSVGVRSPGGEAQILEEQVLLIRKQRYSLPARCDAGRVKRSESSIRPRFVSILSNNRLRNGTRRVIRRGPTASYCLLTSESGQSNWVRTRIGPQRSALRYLLEDESRFPVTSWFRDFLHEDIHRLTLNSLILRNASPPGKGQRLLPDGSNLPWIVQRLRKEDRQSFKSWIDHLRTALPDLDDIRTVVRLDDRHRYLVLHYQGGLRVPSWGVSDGTLRLLALTIIAYMPSTSGVYLIEEPENGIHPAAVDTLCQSLSSVYGAQVLLATHSPIILNQVVPEKVLCFSKSDEGAARIVQGSKHPYLGDWKGEVSLGTLFASGVLS